MSCYNNIESTTDEKKAMKQNFFFMATGLISSLLTL